MSDVAALADPREVVLRFLESVGRRSDAEFYLELFRADAKERFACLHIDGPVVSAASDAVVVDLRFLSVLGLVPVVVVGLFDAAHADDHAELLQRALERVNVDSRRVPWKAAAVDTVIEHVVTCTRAGVVPLVALNVNAGDDEAARFAALESLVLGLQTRKLIFLQRRGGLRADGKIISLVNLTHGFAALQASPELSRKQHLLLTYVRNLICERAAHRLTAAIASPLELLRELFTVKGAGTFLRRGAVITRHDGWGTVDLTRLRHLLDSAFARRVADSFFASAPARIYLEEDYRGAAILMDTPLGAYLSKFAVEREAQGEGIGSDLWDQMTATHTCLFWRSRRSNPIDPWYIRQCEGLVRQGDWNIFWRGLAVEHIAPAVAFALAQPEDFPAPRRGADIAPQS